MLDIWAPLPADTSVVFQVFRYPSSSPLQVLNGTATDGVELTHYVSAMSQSNVEATIRLHWHLELYASGAHPQIDEVVKITLNGRTLWIGIIQGVADYGEERGQRRMTLTARSRDHMPLWREIKAVTDVYSLGTDFSTIIGDVADFLGLAAEERVFPDFSGAYTVHTTTQLSELSPWEMLTVLGQTIGQTPYVDALGRLRFCSRDVSQPAAKTITADRLVRVGGGRAKGRTSRVKLSWLDPNLTESVGQEQVLGNATITAGFFQLKQEEDVYFSDDHTQRAKDTYMDIKQSCNSGLLQVADEDYEQRDDFHGRITLTTSTWVPLLVVGAMVAMAATGDVGDIAPSSGGPTTTVGRRIHAAAELTILTIMASIGTGHYDIRGVPFDYVHQTNTTEAYDSGAPEWAENVMEISNDMVMDETMAQAITIRELVYEIRSSSTHTVELIDDPSIEPGDILQLPSYQRFYVTGYRREMMRGGPHVFSVEGFLV